MRFAIVGLQRTGTSHLVDLLGSHPEIHCCGEIFNQGSANLRRPEEYGDRRAWRQTAKELKEIRSNDSAEFLTRVLALDFGKPVVGFKILRTQNPPMLEKILRNQSIAKIIQSRSNPLARYASLYAATAVGEFGRSAEKPLVEFKAKKFAQFHHEHETFYDEMEHHFETDGRHFYRSRFEDINDAANLIEILKFLGVTPELPSLKGPPPNRGSTDVLSRFSNPDDAAAYLRDHNLMQLAQEGV